MTSNDTRPSNDFLDYALTHDFGDLHFKVDPKTGMKAIIAIHSTKLGPALGGCRFIEYPNTETAIYDAMRLARGMSYKAALVNLPLGGGKSVIIKPKHNYDRTAYLHRFGEFVQEMGGRYITALDSGTELCDMDIIAQHTPYVASLSSHNGDPSPYTARGKWHCLETSVALKLQKNSVEGLHIAIQGLGHVGFLLAQHLHDLGARLTVADINPERVKRAVDAFAANTVSTEDIHKIPCDVFAPCALGAVLNDKTIPELQTTVIAGAANNQLAHSHHGQWLHDRGILYAPDYVINSGGLIFAASRYWQKPDSEMEDQLQHISESLQKIFARSVNEDRPTSDIADTLAKEKLAH